MTPDALALSIAVVIALALMVTAIATARTARIERRRVIARRATVPLGAVFGVLAWGRLIEPRWVAVTELEVTWSGPPLRVAVIGDVHAGRVGREVIARAVRLANESDPDLVLLAGDYITGYELTREKAEILEALRPLHAKRGVFAVLGNHDSEPYASPTLRAGAITRLLEGYGFTVLRNQSIDLGGATLVGLDEVQSGNIDARKAFLGVPEGPRLVITHDWRGLSLPGVGRFDLAVTGHTHGGQICLPIIAWCPFAGKSAPYVAGAYDWPGGGKLFVTRGIGESAVLMRIASRPEVAVITLRPR